MKSLSKMLRGSCAIITSGALVLSRLPAMAQTMAQDQPPPGAQQPPPEAQLPPPGAAQQPPQPAAQQLGQAELEKLLAPIALYPDDLVAQILTASTYPIEVVQAERWVSAHPNVHGDALQDAMRHEQWDASVKGLAAVPQVLSMMNDKLDWTQQLGEAFLAQPNDVSNAIQQLRAKAQANGNLKSSDKIKVSSIAQAEPPPPVGPPPPGVDVLADRVRDRVRLLRARLVVQVHRRRPVGLVDRDQVLADPAPDLQAIRIVVHDQPVGRVEDLLM